MTDADQAEIELFQDALEEWSADLPPAHCSSNTTSTLVSSVALPMQQEASGTGKDGGGAFPLHRAAFYNQAEEIGRLLQGMSHAEMKELDTQGNTALHLAVRRRSLAAVAALLSGGFPAYARNARGWGVVIEAVDVHDAVLARVLARAEAAAAKRRAKEKRALLAESLRGMPDFTMQLKWELGSSMPGVGLLLRSVAPHDTYTLWKRGACLRVDGSLMGIDEEASSVIPAWKRGHFSLLYDAGLPAAGGAGSSSSGGASATAMTDSADASSSPASRSRTVGSCGGTALDSAGGSRGIEGGSGSAAAGGGGGTGTSSGGGTSSSVPPPVSSRLLFVDHGKKQWMDLKALKKKAMTAEDEAALADQEIAELLEEGGPMTRSSVRLKGFRFSPVLGWFGRETNETLDGWQTKLYEAAGQVHTVKKTKATCPIDSSMTFEQYLAATFPADEILESAFNPLSLGKDRGDKGSSKVSGKGGLKVNKHKHRKAKQQQQQQQQHSESALQCTPAGPSSSSTLGSRASPGGNALVVEELDEEAEEGGWVKTAVVVGKDADPGPKCGSKSAVVDGDEEEDGSDVESASQHVGVGPAGTSAFGHSSSSRRSGAAHTDSSKPAVSTASGDQTLNGASAAAALAEDPDAASLAAAAAAAEAEVAAAAAAVEGEGEGGGGGKGRKVTARCWLAQDFPMSLHQLLPLLDVIGAANKHVGKVAKFMRKYGEQEAFPVRMQIPLMMTVYALLSMKEFKLLPPLPPMPTAPPTGASPAQAAAGAGGPAAAASDAAKTASATAVAGTPVKKKGFWGRGGGTTTAPSAASSGAGMPASSSDVCQPDFFAVPAGYEQSEIDLSELEGSVEAEEGEAEEERAVRNGRRPPSSGAGKGGHSKAIKKGKQARFLRDDDDDDVVV